MKTNYEILFACINHAKQIGRLEKEIENLLKKKDEISKSGKAEENEELLNRIDSEFYSYSYEKTRLQANIDTVLWILEE